MDSHDIAGRAREDAEREAQLAKVRPHLSTTKSAATRSTSVSKEEAMAAAIVDIVKRALTTRDDKIALLEARVRTLEEIAAKQEVVSR